MQIKDCDSLSYLTSNDVIDTRDLQELIGSLKKLRDEAASEKSINQRIRDGAESGEEQHDAEEAFDEDKQAMLAELEEIEDEFSLDEALIRESYWQDYCEQLATDCEYIVEPDKNPLMSCIDWEKWADMVRADYSTVTIDGVDYYTRNC